MPLLAPHEERRREARGTTPPGPSPQQRLEPCREAERPGGHVTTLECEPLIDHHLPQDGSASMQRLRPAAREGNRAQASREVRATLAVLWGAASPLVWSGAREATVVWEFREHDDVPGDGAALWRRSGAERSLMRRINRPQVYFGEETSTYIGVLCGTTEFDHRRRTDNAYTTYEGRDGVALGHVWQPALFAWHFGDLRLLISKNVTVGERDVGSRIHFRCWVQNRISRVALFLRLDYDPYLVVSEARLIWLQDACPVSGAPPYSHADRGGVNYIRNSVKVTVDAYDGTLALYVADHLRADLPDALPVSRCHAPGAPAASPVPRGLVPAAGHRVRDLPHDRPGGLLQPRGSVDLSTGGRERADHSHATLRRDYAAARRTARSIH